MGNLLDDLIKIAPPKRDEFYPGPFSEGYYKIGVIYDNDSRRDEIKRELSSKSSVQVCFQEFLLKQDETELDRYFFIELPLCQSYYLEESYESFFDKDVFLLIDDRPPSHKQELKELCCYCSFMGIPIYWIFCNNSKYSISEDLTLSKDNQDFIDYKNKVSEHLKGLTDITIDPNYDFESWEMPNQVKNLCYDEVLSLPVTLIRRIEEFQSFWSYVFGEHDKHDEEVYAQEKLWLEQQIKTCIGQDIKVNIFDWNG